MTSDGRRHLTPSFGYHCRSLLILYWSPSLKNPPYSALIASMKINFLNETMISLFFTLAVNFDENLKREFVEIELLWLSSSPGSAESCRHTGAQLWNGWSAGISHVTEAKRENPPPHFFIRLISHIFLITQQIIIIIIMEVWENMNYSQVYIKRKEKRREEDSERQERKKEKYIRGRGFRWEEPAIAKRKRKRKEKKNYRWM